MLSLCVEPVWVSDKELDESESVILEELVTVAGYTVVGIHVGETEER